ncbi:transcriptional regulator [Sphingobacterium siyangense]|uniref:Uncharacterized protein n=1 Tax=Sphingobacterium siyangense TaxID=459529 RepID=A0A562M233_9SPHI|nr:transcriptional regulator [Sphingobacterium siyangense]TWI13994.1 hypothetical protein IQ31_05369 [Sphingobacterium siyangense]
MNYIKQLTHFFNKAQADSDFSATHLSLFMALFQLWNQARFAKQIQIIRDDAMRLGKINSKATYHKAMAYLHKQGYIDYRPSYNPYKGSTITFFPEQPPRSLPNAEPVQILSTRPINEPYNKLYSTSIIMDNTSDLSIDQKSEKNKKTASSNQGVLLFPKKEKGSAQKEIAIPPLPEQVEGFFLASQSTVQEAHRFINHYTANGWLVGGKSPMKDWKASAKNWISNSINFTKSANYGKSNRAQQLHTSTRKNYFEPL